MSEPLAAAQSQDPIVSVAQPPMPKPLVPIAELPAYISSYTVKIGVSEAYSIRHNPRGMETKWYGPWTHTCCELVSALPGRFVIYPQHPLWIPSIKLEELRLRREFEDEGLPYDSDQDQPQRLKNPLSTRPGSVRIENIERRAKEAEKAKKLARIQALDQRLSTLHSAAAKLLEDKEEEEKEEEPAPDASIDSIGSITDRGAKDRFPDIFVAHVVGCAIRLPAPDSKGFKQACRHFAHRGGIKTYHSCGGLIIEIKSAARRGGYHAGLRMLEEAINDLIEYCATYFACHLGAKQLLAIAAVGPAWTWANIQRSDVPAWDWTFGMVAPNQKMEVNTFHGKFSDPFDLTSLESDAKLTELRNDYLYPMLTDGHLPAIPRIVAQMRDGTYDWAALVENEDENEDEHRAEGEDEGGRSNEDEVPGNEDDEDEVPSSGEDEDEDSGDDYQPSE